MKQKIFSQYVFDFLEKTFPEFISAIKYQKDGSFDCILKSPTGNFSIWIATYNEEITFGIESPDGKTDIHTHISCYEIEDCFESLTRLINQVKENKLIVYLNDANIYDWVSYDKLLEKESTKGKLFQKFFWSDN